MRRRHLIGIIIVVLAISFCGMALRDSLSPYVSFAEARESTKIVQVKGDFVDKKVSLWDEGRGISFFLEDEEGTRVRVVYAGAAPDNISHATSVVVAGQYQGADFLAERILVKCPSKYQVEGDRQ
ncbi:MAG: cytochrome c maturation protein CcmE [Clostridiales bacterium]|nr:cytochrome c maturation protein CcmE [Clostridiales bacterium]